MNSRKLAVEPAKADFLAGGGPYNPTKLLTGQILVVFGIELAGVWFATQWAAAHLAYQSELGQPWFIVFGHSI